MKMQARVKWFDKSKGYGFIEQPGKEDIFIHYSNIDMNGFKTLNEGQLVEFEMKTTEKGYQAINIRPIKELETIK